MELVASLLLLIVVAGLIGRAMDQQRYFRVLQPVAAPSEEAAPWIAVIVPARNEASKIGACLEGLAGQTYPSSRLTVHVIDDGSSDGTKAISADIARTCPMISVTSAPPPTPGWTGKSHACWFGAQRDADSEWLCFLDADTRPRPELLASALAAAQQDGLDFLSLAPRQELESAAERLVMPCGFYLLAFTHDVRDPLDPECEKTAACGQFILVRRSAYEKAGGHAAVAGALSEDLELARVLKRNGCRTAMFGGDRLISARMYEGYASLRTGVTRNLVDMLGGPARALTIISAGVVPAWASVALPFSTVLTWNSGVIETASLLAACIAAAAAFGFHIAGARHFSIPVWYGLLFPVGYTIGAKLVIESIWRRRTGRVVWKGRTYPGERHVSRRSGSAPVSDLQRS